MCTLQGCIQIKLEWCTLERIPPPRPLIRKTVTIKQMPGENPDTSPNPNPTPTLI